MNPFQLYDTRSILIQLMKWSIELAIEVRTRVQILLKWSYFYWISNCTDSIEVINCMCWSDLLKWSIEVIHSIVCVSTYIRFHKHTHNIHTIVWRTMEWPSIMFYFFYSLPSILSNLFVCYECLGICLLRTYINERPYSIIIYKIRISCRETYKIINCKRKYPVATYLKIKRESDSSKERIRKKRPSQIKHNRLCLN